MMEGTVVVPKLDVDKVWELMVAALDDDGSERAEREIRQMEDEHDFYYEKLYEALVAGKIKSFDYKEHEGKNWRIIVRSTHPESPIVYYGLWIRDGKFIPVFDAPINCFEDLRKRIPQEETTVRWRI